MRVLPGDIIACLYDQFGSVKVYDDGNKRYLSFGEGDEQSCMVKAAPKILQYDYNRAMALVLLFYRIENMPITQPQQLLILGMGGGSLLKCFAHHIADAEITVVELRQAVIDVARKYFDIPSAKPINIIHDDALSYINQAEAGKYDLLFSDLYIPEGLEARQLTRQFLAAAKRVLNDDGFLVINALEEYRTSQVLASLFNQSFATTYECITKDGNWVVIATNNPLASREQLKLKSLKQQAKDLSDELGFSIQQQFKLLK